MIHGAAHLDPHVPPPPPTDLFIVFTESSNGRRGVRLFREPVRARNERVAVRAGGTVKPDVAATAIPGNATVLVVPPGVVINPWLFPLDGPGIVVARPGLGSEDAVLDVSTRGARRRAAWRIVRHTAKSTDGWVSRRVNRPVSRIVSLGLLTIGLRAAHASAITLAVGLIAACVAAQPGYVALAVTGLLFQLASMLDGVDGEMARATLTESDSGARMDTVVDQATYLACFAGVSIGWIREGGAVQAIAWTAAVAMALVVTLVRAARFVSQCAPDSSFVFIDRCVRRAAIEAGTLPLQAAAASFAVLRRDLFAIVFMVIGLAGIRALVPVLVAAGVVVANLTFSIYNRELLAAAVAERPASPSI